MTKRIVRLALAASAVVAVALPAAPAHAHTHCISYRTYQIICPPQR